MNVIVTLIGFGIVQSAIFAVATTGLTLQFGVSNYINFAYGEFMTFGALVCWFFAEGGPNLPLWASIVVAVVATGLLSMVVQRFLFGPFSRRRPQLLFALVVTFATSIALNNVWGVIWGTAYRQMPTLLPLNATFNVGPVALNQNDGLYLLMAVGAIVLVELMLFRTSLGTAMRAISDSQSLARVTGLNVARTTDITWLIAGALAGLGGVLLAIETYTFNLDLGGSYLFLLFAAVIVGGIGKPRGALLGALIVGLTTELAAIAVPSALTLAAVFVILILVLLIRPAGLLGQPGSVTVKER
jgi:branched-subunit amino acid ABC-type transport system permease component